MLRDFGAVRYAYKRWYEECRRADEEFMRFKGEVEADGDSCEDLGDFVEAMLTLRSFGPNPKKFDEEDE